MPPLSQNLLNVDTNRDGMEFYTVGTGVLDGPEIELTKYGPIADKYIHQLPDFYEDLSVESYVIMPNHIHIMLRVNGAENGPSRTPVPTFFSISSG